MAEARRTVTLPGGRSAQMLPPAIRDIVARFFLHNEMANEMVGVNGCSGDWMRSEPERRAAMIVSLADASDIPRLVWSAVLNYLCFDKEPSCTECGQPARVYDCLRDGEKLPVHRFLCERHAPVGGAAR